MEYRYGDMKRACLFLDRDGVINRRPDPERYVRSTKQFILIPEILDVLHLAKAREYPVVVVTNQRGIAIGSMSQLDVDEIHNMLRTLLAKEGLALLDILVCPHDDNQHPWRKPNPGMLIEAAKRHDLDLQRSWMVGDHLTDVYAGKAAGCQTILVDHDDPEGAADFIAHGIAEVTQILFQQLESCEEPLG